MVDLNKTLFQRHQNLARQYIEELSHTRAELAKLEQEQRDLARRAQLSRPSLALSQPSLEQHSVMANQGTPRSERNFMDEIDIERNSPDPETQTQILENETSSARLQRVERLLVQELFKNKLIKTFHSRTYNTFFLNFRHYSI